MSKYFTSVLKLVESSRDDPSANKDASPPVQVDLDSSRLTLQLQSDQPRPHGNKTLGYDKILSTTTSSSDLYKETAKEVVEGALLGYHGTVIAFSNSQTAKEKSDALFHGREGMIQKAAKQMFRCLKKSRKSKTKSSASNLVILCSFVIVLDEEVRDLFCDVKKGEKRRAGDKEGTYLPPKLEIVSGRLRGASQHPLNTSAELAGILKSGRETKETILNTLYGSSSAVTHLHHTIFTLTVEFSQFGSMNAPVSGNLLFVDLAVADALAKRQSYMRGDVIDAKVRSLFTFSDVVLSLSQSVSQIDTLTSDDSAFDLEAEPHLLHPHVPTTMDGSNLHNNSVLTQLIRESLGGNCKTLLITFLDPNTSVIKSPEILETLKLASRARIIQNTPNKRDLAEKALMSAYLRGLEEVYGQEVREKEEQPLAVLHSPLAAPAPGGWEVGGAREEITAVGGSQASLKSDDIDNAYDQMIHATKGEERQKNMELAATALVAAALEYKEEEEEEEGEESGSDSEYEDDVFSVESSSVFASSQLSEATLKNSSILTSSQASDTTIRSKQSTAKLRDRRKSKRKESVVILQDKEQNVTLEVLVAMLQDPDEGVPHPSREQLHNVHINKDAGAIFSGSAITKWLMTHISGVKSENDAQMLGQLLLENGLILHSEGSRVFADADTLFYHARKSRTNKKSLSYDEVQKLIRMNQPASTDKERTVSTEVSDLNDTEVKVYTPEVKVHSPEVKVSANKLTQPRSPNISSPEHTHVLDDSVTESAIKFGEDMKVRDLNDTRTTVEGHAHSTEPGGVAGGERPEAIATTEGVVREEWMKTGESDNEGEEEGEGPGEEFEDEVTSEPNTAPLERIPSLHTLENTVNYPHPLHMAAAIGKSPGVIRELVMMFGVNKLDTSSRTPLMFAALGNNKSSSCATLLRCSAEVDLQDISGLTALHVACYHGNKSAASILLSNKASIATRDKLGHTALHWSMVPNDPACLQLLTLYTLHPDLLNHVDRSGLTAIHWSIFYNHPQHLSVLLKRCNRKRQIELTQLDAEGRTLATYTVEKNSPSCLKILLEAEPSLLTLPDHQGTLPIHHACTNPSPDTLNTLLNFNPPKKSPIPVTVDLEARDDVQRTCLHYAVACSGLGVASVLVSRGAQVDSQDSEGRTPIDYAMELVEGKEEMLAVLRGEGIASQVSEGAPNAAKKKDGPKEKPGGSEQERPRQRSKFCNLL